MIIDKLIDEAFSLSAHGEPDAAEEILKGIADDPRAKFNLGWHAMRHGDMLSGFDGMNSGRWLNVFGEPPLINGVPIWRDGESLEGKRLIYRCEGGLGDEICNIRFVRDFIAKGALVTIACSGQLMRLFSQFDCSMILTEHVNAVYADYWIPAMSAAGLLGYTHEDFPGKKYLSAHGVDFGGESLKIGIKWSGNPEFEHEQYRKFDPQFMVDLIHTFPDAAFFALQRDGDLLDVPCFDLRNQMPDMQATAEIITGLDLVITSCTSVAHLAGALGIPAWVVIPVMPYYTWAYPGEKTIWYDSVKLYRQTVFGLWDDVFLKVKEDLADVLYKKK